MKRRAIVGMCLVCWVGCGDDAALTECPLGDAREGFSNVSNMLGARCGSLDCHGQVGRPLRLYSARGLRLDRDDVSGHGGTRSAEHEANLRATLGLEPELSCEVLAAHGREPERLTLVRKAFGLEAHTAGEVLPPGDDARACLLGWLAGRVDADRCQQATEQGRPE